MKLQRDIDVWSTSGGDSTNPDGKKKRITFSYKTKYMAYKELFENTTKRVNLLTWLAAIGWILFTLLASGCVIDFLQNHLQP